MLRRFGSRRYAIALSRARKCAHRARSIYPGCPGSLRREAGVSRGLLRGYRQEPATAAGYQLGTEGRGVAAHSECCAVLRYDVGR